ncbi:hypothetical protein AB0J38_27805 [Streptomyces sp. NPDC050095]|uniref:hypothetical protein n=1 Tax=unclassified Streptomyces TaxID=2593676 RepID=UPI00342FA8BB
MDEKIEVVVNFTVDDHRMISEHANELAVPVGEYVRQAAAQRARDGQAKRALLAEAAVGRRYDGALIEGLADPCTLSAQEQDARAREVADDLGIEYTEQVRELGRALWEKIRLLHDAHREQRPPGQAGAGEATGPSS